jgi:hypothetical protein
VREALARTGGLRIDVLSRGGSYYLSLGAESVPGFRPPQGDNGVRTVTYSTGVSLDCYTAGPDRNDWGAPDAELHRFQNPRHPGTGMPVRLP